MKANKLRKKHWNPELQMEPNFEEKSKVEWRMGAVTVTQRTREVRQALTNVGVSALIKRFDERITFLDSRSDRWNQTLRRKAKSRGGSIENEWP